MVDILEGGKAAPAAVAVSDADGAGAEEAASGKSAARRGGRKKSATPKARGTSVKGKPRSGSSAAATSATTAADDDDDDCIASGDENDGSVGAHGGVATASRQLSVTTVGRCDITSSEVSPQALHAQVR